MTKNLISWLLLLGTFSFLLHSCVHDEMNTNSQEISPAPSAKYTNKSLWKEDEAYIKNVMKVFDEYADRNYFTSSFGTVYWDYALTFGTFDESYLEVPVIKNNKVSFIMVVYRENDRIFFKRKEDTASDAFFNALVFNDRSKYKIEANNGTLNTAAKGCISTVTTWTWTNEDGSAGPTYQYTAISCTPVGPKLPCQSVDPDDANCGGSVGNNPGGGPGGGGYPYPSQNENPCERTKNMFLKAGVQPKLDELIEQAPKGGEIGVKFKPDGTPSPTIYGRAHSVNFGDKTGYAGGYHNHTPTGIPMLSPPDIDQLLGFARAQPTSNPLNVNNAYVGMIAPNGMHYVIWFNGTYQDAITNFSQDDLDLFSDKYRDSARDLKEPILNGTKYIDSNGEINNLGVETLFFETLKEMGLDGKVNLQRIESGGTVKIIGLDGSNQPVSTTCS